MAAAKKATSKKSASAKKAPAKKSGKKKVAATKRKTAGDSDSTAKSAATKAPVKKRSPRAKAASTPKSQFLPVGAEQRWRMIAEAAYLRAEQRGFSPGNEVEDWLAAEAEVDARLAVASS